MLNFRPAARQSGVTLVELMTSVSILSILAALATPSFASFMRNTEVRGSSESLMQGLQYARTEAIRRNRNICFDWSGNGTGWTVNARCVDVPGSVPTSQQILSQPDREGSMASLITPTPATAVRVTFNGFGRVVPNVVGGASLKQLDIVAVNANLGRRIQISANDSSGRLVVCDPSVASGLPLACS